MNTEQEYYWFRNTTDSIIIINDLQRPASIPARGLSRSFSSDEVNQSSDLRRFYQLGILIQDDSQAADVVPMKKSSVPMPATLPRRRPLPEGVEIQDLGDHGNSSVSSQGTEFVNPKFAIGDYVYLKGPSNLSGRISGRRGVDGRWKIELQDGRIAYAYEDAMMTVDQYAMSEPASATPTRTTLNASDVLKRGLVSPEKQQEFRRRNNTRMHADDIIRNRTATPASQLQGQPPRNDDDTRAPVGGKRFTVDEVKNRPLNPGGVDIVMDGRVVNSEDIVSEKLHSSASGDEQEQGTIIVDAPKDNPVGGEETTPTRMVGDSIKSTTRALSRAEKKREYNRRFREKVKAKPAAKPQSIPKSAPAHVAEFLKMSPNEQKLTVVRTNEIESLHELAGYISEGQPMRKLIEDRVAQLQVG